jgi:hypothetical protein
MRRKKEDDRKQKYEGKNILFFLFGKFFFKDAEGTR